MLRDDNEKLWGLCFVYCMMHVPSLMYHAKSDPYQSQNPRWPQETLG